MKFNGFSPKTSDFFWKLKFNNNKQWFDEHREDYVNYVQMPLKSIANEVFDYMNMNYSEDNFKLHISRINRDARRPSPNGPYKDHMWFSVFNGLANEYSRPAFFMGISDSGYSIGMGIYKTNQTIMNNYRKIVLSKSDNLIKLDVELNKQSIFVLGGEEYKKSKGDAGELLNNWINRKELYVICNRPYSEEIFCKDFKIDLINAFDFLYPYYKFIENVCLTAE